MLPRNGSIQDGLINRTEIPPLNISPPLFIKPALRNRPPHRRILAETSIRNRQDSTDQQGLCNNPCSSSPQPTKQSVHQLHEITEEPLSRNHGHGTVQSQTPVPPRSHSFATVYNRNRQEVPKIYGKNPSVSESLRKSMSLVFGHFLPATGARKE